MLFRSIHAWDTKHGCGLDQRVLENDFVVVRRRNRLFEVLELQMDLALRLHGTTLSNRRIGQTSSREVAHGEGD